MEKTIDSKISFNSTAVENVNKKMIESEYVTKLTSFFKAVGEENRVRIIYALWIEELCVNDLSVALDISQSLVSHQLKLLRMEGLVKSRRDGKNIYYSLDDQHVVDILYESLKHVMHKTKDGQQ